MCVVTKDDLRQYNTPTAMNHVRCDVHVNAGGISLITVRLAIGAATKPAHRVRHTSTNGHFIHSIKNILCPYHGFV